MSRFQTPEIVQPGSRRFLWVWVLLLAAVAVLAWKMFEFGRASAGFDSAARDTQVELLEERIAALQAERDQLRAAAAKFERASQIDQSAVASVQAQLKALQDERSALRQEVEFLKSLVSGDITALQLSDLSLRKEDGDEGAGYRFAFTISKRAKDDDRVQGTVSVLLSGQLQGEAKTLDSKALGIDAKDLRMGFNHFQKFAGALRLPVGFIPRELQVAVKPKGKKFKAFEQTFEWRVN